MLVVLILHFCNNGEFYRGQVAVVRTVSSVKWETNGVCHGGWSFEGSGVRTVGEVYAKLFIHVFQILGQIYRFCLFARLIKFILVINARIKRDFTYSWEFLVYLYTKYLEIYGFMDCREELL